VSEAVNHDPRVGDLLKVVFLPNYNVSLAEAIFPATELSEQISTAGTEASGTGNMKAMLNGALTIGTLDGANIEILEAVGEQNIFIFGMSAEEVARRVADGNDPWQTCRQDSVLEQAIDMIRGGFFTAGDRAVFQPLVDSIFREGDRFMVLGDFADYVACHERAANAYLDQAAWTRKSIVNVARAGRFSSDQTALNYARNVWGLDVDRSKQPIRLVPASQVDG
jgi:starch phosphorylase